jgi:DNA methylase
MMLTCCNTSAGIVPAQTLFSMNMVTAEPSPMSLSVRNIAPSCRHLPDRWHRAPRRWGHPLHSICSYFAMFPPQIAHVFITWLTHPGDTVYDPFSGRGTVPLEAVLSGRVGLGSDANPLAYSLTQAKVAIPNYLEIDQRLTKLERSYRGGKVRLDTVPDDIAMLYAPGTLRQLVHLQSQLHRDRAIDAFLIAMTLGMLHANHSRNGATRGFSISMPNTFAMSPRYVERYIKEHGLQKPELDVFSMLRERALRLSLPARPVATGRAWLQDATADLPDWLDANKPKLIFTSPPYLQVIKYGKYNWVRLWFLGESSRAVDDQLMASGSLDRYIDFMAKVCINLRTAIADDGYLCFVIGDVRRGETQLNLAEAVWDRVAKPLGWHRHAIIADNLPARQKVSRIWKNNEGRATKTDRLLLLSPKERDLPSLKPIRWDVPTFAEEITQ